MICRTEENVGIICKEDSTRGERSMSCKEDGTRGETNMICRTEENVAG